MSDANNHDEPVDPESSSKSQFPASLPPSQAAADKRSSHARSVESNGTLPIHNSLPRLETRRRRDHLLSAHTASGHGVVVAWYDALERSRGQASTAWTEIMTASDSRGPAWSGLVRLAGLSKIFFWALSCHDTTVKVRPLFY